MKILKSNTILTVVTAFALVLASTQCSEAGIGKIWPFATKKHVKNQIDPLSGRVGELEEVNREHSRKIKDVDDRAQAGINAAMKDVNQADSKAQLADQNAQEAGKTARQATEKITSVQADMDSRLGNIENYRVSQTLQVNFAFNQSTLNEDSRLVLDDLTSEIKNSKGYLLEVEGFTDPRGSSDRNLELSQARANSVVRYLVERHEVPLFRIRTIGQGESQTVKKESGKVDNNKSRRVEIHVLKNEAMVEVAKKDGF